MNDIDYHQLFKKIKNDHGEINSILSNIDNVIRSYADAKLLLRELERLLFYHFSLQEEEFFQRLKTLFAWSSDELAIIDFFITDTRSIKVETLRFFDDFPSGMLDGKSSSFIIEFTDFSGIMRQRIKSEDQYLLPYIEKIINDKKINE